MKIENLLGAEGGPKNSKFKLCPSTGSASMWDSMKAANSDTAPRAAPSRFGPMLLTLGPGIVLTGSVVGSGELINTPIQAARFGFVLLWAVIISCLIKYFLQVEIGRHCMVHNRTALEAFNLFPGPKIRNTSWIVLVFMAGWTIAQVGSAGIIGATAGLLRGLLPTGSITTWAVIVVLLIQLLLWKGLYADLEKLVVVLVGGFSVVVVAGVILVQGTEYRLSVSDIYSGLTFSLGERSHLAAYAVISLMGGLGVGATELIMYPYWVLEKGYARHVGPSDSAGWLDRARGWIRILQVDAGLATLLATVITAAYFLLGATILFRLGQEPQGPEVVDRISGIFTQTYGNWSRGVFLVGAFCTLFSTLLAATAANGRVFADLLCCLGFVDRKRPASVQRSHQVFQTLFLAAVLTVFLWMPSQPQKLIILSHYTIGLLLTPPAMLGICWLAFQTDRRLRMSRLTTVFLLGSVLVITACLGFALFGQSGVSK